MSTSAAHVLAGFGGTRLDDAATELLSAPGVAGVTLFRHHNVGAPADVRALADAIAGLGDGDVPALVAVDQETGQLVGLGPATTPFPGAMALGAVDDPDLTERVSHAVGTEMRAMGATVAYAPVCDLASSPANPGLGIRSFGDDPARVAEHVAAWVRGLGRAGVAAVAKHFPGLGDVVVDTHHGPGSVPHDRERLDALELRPFRAAVDAGVAMVMTGHIDVPAVTGEPGLPATLSPVLVHDMLRDGCGFDGLVVTDALDMAALAQGDAGLVDAVAALRAGVDLLLCPADLELSARLVAVVGQAVRRGIVPADHVRATARRLRDLHARLAAHTGPRPDLDVVGTSTHRQLAREVADRSITAVRGHPAALRDASTARVLVVHPGPSDRTPADTSSEVVVDLAAALRTHLPTVTSFVTAPSPAPEEIARAVDLAGDHDHVVVGTMDAGLDPSQADLVAALRTVDVPLATVALRTPWDLAVHPDVSHHVCTYSLQPPSIDALAGVLVGVQPARGRLPVRLEGAA